jgi:hypothetical protein
MSQSYGLSYTDGFGRRWGHFAPQLLSVSIVVAILLGIRPLMPTPATLLGIVSLLVFVVLTWLRMREHDRRLCESCAASMPLNASEHAARHQRRFWLAHTGSNKRIVIPYVVVLVGSNFLTSPSGRIVWAIVQSSMIYLLLSYDTHRKLQPWCPWCSGGGGGSDRDEQVPDPDLPRGNRLQLH